VELDPGEEPRSPAFDGSALSRARSRGDWDALEEALGVLCGLDRGRWRSWVRVRVAGEAAVSPGEAARLVDVDRWMLGGLPDPLRVPAVALVAFRGESAELLLPPTRSLTRARRSLAELPGGGGTPLALGLNAAREVAEAVIARGRSAALVILTDGRANIAADGSPGRPQARLDAEAAAKAIYARGIDALVVDISARPGPEGAELARALGGRFLALPRADARLLQQAINAAQPAVPA
jgi:hypothetical protein